MTPARAHILPQALASARLRARLQAARGGGGRVAARRLAALPPLPDLDGVDPAALALCLDPDRRECVFALAAAALNGAAVAMIVTPEDRRRLVLALGDAVRDFAVRHRGLGRIPTRLPEVEDLLRRIDEDRAAVRDCWCAALPEGLDQPAAAPCDPRAAACLAAALEDRA